MAAPQFMQTHAGDFFGADSLPVLEEIFKSELARHPSRREKLFKVVKHDREIYQVSGMEDLPLMNTIAEGAAYTFTKPNQGYDMTLAVVKKGLGVSFSEELFEDQKWDIVGDAVKKLAKSAMESQEVDAMNVFNNAFTTQLTADGLPLCSGSGVALAANEDPHTTPGGTYTIRNVLATAADLSQTSLALALSDFEKVFVGDTGIIYKLQPRNLVVPSELRLYAKELIGSELKPDTANNNINSIADEGLVVVSSAHLTDADAWFLTADAVDTGLRIVSRKPIETKAAGPDHGFDNDTISYKTRYREKVGSVSPLGVFGTPGAA